MTNFAPANFPVAKDSKQADNEKCPLSNIKAV